jgi:hypothetical protein
MDRFGPVRHDRVVDPKAPRLKLVPEAPNIALIRRAFQELHDLSTPGSEAAPVPETPSRRWHPSMGSRLAAVR